MKKEIKRVGGREIGRKGKEIFQRYFTREILFRVLKIIMIKKSTTKKFIIRREIIIIFFE